MDEVQMRDTSLAELHDEIKAICDNLDKSKRRAQDIDDIEDKLHTYENNLDAMQMELKSLPMQQKKIYRKKHKEHKQKLKEIRNELEWKKSSNAKRELVGDHIEDKPDLTTADGMMDHGRNVLADSKESLARSLAVVADTTQIGRATAQRLAAQREQLEKIFDDIKSIDSTLSRSNKILRRIARKIGTDKYLWVVIFLVFFFIIFIIAWKASGRSADVNTPSV